MTLTPQEAKNRLNKMKEYYNDRTEPYYVGFDYMDNEAVDMAIKALEQTELKLCGDTLKKIRTEILDEYAYADFDEYKYDIMIGRRKRDDQ